MHCNALQRTGDCNALQRTATHCNALQHAQRRTATHRNALQCALPRTATHCNALQHTATHYNAQQCAATHCNALQRIATHCHTHCNALQRTTTDRLNMDLVAVLRVVSLARTVLLPSVLLLQRLVSRSHSVHALLYSFHPTNCTQCFTLSCFSLAQHLLHCCSCIPRSHCGMPIPPSHSVVFLDRTVLYSSTMRICSVLAQHFNDIHIHTYLYSVTPVTAQD